VKFRPEIQHKHTRALRKNFVCKRKIINVVKCVTPKLYPAHRAHTKPVENNSQLTKIK
jgi:hypothetical protein